MRLSGLSRRSFLGALGGAALLPLAGACKAIPIGGGGGGAAATSGTVEFMGHFTPVGTNDVRDDASKNVWTTFQGKYPNITIKWQQTAWQTIGEKYMAAWSAGSAPDISLFSPANIAPALLLGSVDDLSPHLNTWQQADKDDYPKVWWDVGTYNGKKYIAPLLLFGALPLYRKSIMQEAGQKFDQIKTWDDWRKALQAVTKDGQGRPSSDPAFDPASVKVWGFAIYAARGSGASIPYFNTMLIERLGKQSVEPPDWKADRWITAEAVDIVTIVTNWVKKDKIQPQSTLNMNLSDADKFFASGLATAYSFGTNTYPTARANMQFDPMDAVFAKIPSFDANKPGPIDVNHWSMGVSSKSKNKDAAYTVIDAWLTKEADLEFAKTAGQQPKRTSTISDPFFEKPENAYFKTFADAQKAWAVPDLSAPVRTDDILLEAYHSVITQNVAVKDAMQQAYDKYSKLLADVPKEKLPQA